jgi:hypothetical protein
MNNEDLINTQLAIMLTTYLVKWGYISSSLMLVAIIFNFRKTAIAIGMFYTFVMFITPYSITTGLGLLLILLYLGLGAYKLGKLVWKKVHARRSRQD